MRIDDVIGRASLLALGACALARGGLFETSDTTSSAGGGTSSAGGAPRTSSATAAAGSAGSGGIPSGSAGGSGGVPNPLDCSSNALIACYRFEGDVDDASSFGHDLVPQGMLQHTAGVDGQAVVISENTTLTTPPTSDWVSSTLTVEMWIYPVTLPSVRAGLLDANCCYSIFLYADGQIRCDAGGTQIYGGQVSAGSWIHVACVYDGSSITAYVNGAVVANAAAGALTSLTDTVGVGLNMPEQDARLDGYIDSLRVWSVGLDAQQICDAAACGADFRADG